MTLSSRTRLGPYEMLGLLGAGGMGEVYRARDTRLQRDVAVKVLPARLSSDPARLKRFEREARSASALNQSVAHFPAALSAADVSRRTDSGLFRLSAVPGRS
jgi:serine/threonine protein kinase